MPGEVPSVRGSVFEGFSRACIFFVLVDWFFRVRFEIYVEVLIFGGIVGLLFDGRNSTRLCCCYRCC